MCVYNQRVKMVLYTRLLSQIVVVVSTGHSHEAASNSYYAGSASEVQQQVQASRKRERQPVRALERLCGSNENGGGAARTSTQPSTCIARPMRGFERVLLEAARSYRT